MFSKAFVFMMECPECYRILHLKKTLCTHTAANPCESITCFIGSINISFMVKKTNHLTLFILWFTYLLNNNWSLPPPYWYDVCNTPDNCRLPPLPNLLFDLYHLFPWCAPLPQARKLSSIQGDNFS